MIVGLGNIGKKFIGSRHNMGSDYILNLSKKFNVKFKKIPKLFGYLSEIIVFNKKIILLIPDAFINNSGKSIHIVSHFYKIDLNNILIVHDELDFLPGIIKFKYGGSSGGHNGLKDIIKIFNSEFFYRLRIGIGYPNNKLKINNFLLSKPTKIEQKNINSILEYSIDSVLIFIKNENYNKAVTFLHSLLKKK
ncbi:aminoacyl-tRNA hydrolase [Enterobacteriaceae endosymbiont of Donacia tomentosa]|nr:aminoacyl-tRNA hydrolase [Enterobacteriaceae endosymbiont of Donacia tomentosa]